MKRVCFLLLTAFVCLCASPLAAEPQYIPTTIQFKGAPEYSSQELMAAMELKMGIPLNYTEMKAHGQKLLDTGLFESFNFTYNGMDLVFNMVPSSVLYPVRLENLPLTTGKELDAALHSRLPLYHGKVPAEGGINEAVRLALQEMLAAKLIQATVTAMPYTDQKLHEVTAISYAVTAPPVRVGNIHLEGVSPEMQAKVKVVEQSIRKTGFDTEHSADNIERALSLCYSDEGYAAVKVHAVRSGEPVASSAAIDVPFSVTVEEGRLYKLGVIHLPSGELLTMEQINKAAGLVTNKVETALSVKGGVALRTALSYVTGECKSKGYMECVVTPHPQFDDANSIVNYTFEVQTGPVYTMGKLIIENGADDLRAAMLAAWKLPEGTVFNLSAIQTYYSSQGNTPLGRTFASVNCKYKLATNIETHTVDVTLRLERKN
jgi:outer membrane protein assembly factor BamA